MREDVKHSLREAMIICPMADNTGKIQPNVYRGARDACITAFNGCTIRYAEGYWRGDDGKLFMENVAELMVVCNDDAANRETLEAIADQIGYKHQQYAVYIRYASGNVVLRPTAQFWQTAKAG